LLLTLSKCALAYSAFAGVASGIFKENLLFK